MDEVKFNIRSLFNPNRVGGKTNDLDSKEKEKSYGKKNRKEKKKEFLSNSGPLENSEESMQDEKNKKKVVDVFI